MQEEFANHQLTDLTEDEWNQAFIDIANELTIRLAQQLIEDSK